MNKFLKDSSLVLVGANAIFVNSNNNIVGKSSYCLNNRSIIKGMMKDNVFIHSSVVFKKKVYYLTSGYNVNYKEGAQLIADYNLWFELMKFGAAENIKERTVFYRVLESSLSRNVDGIINYQARLYVMRNVYDYFRRDFIYSIFHRNKVNLIVLMLKFKKALR